MELLAQHYLLYFILPLWLLTGVCDWLCHRLAHIENTTGWPESALHLLMLAEGGIAIIFGLLFEITGLVLSIMLAAWFIHEITTFADLLYASSRRRVGAIEQRVHDYLGVIPFLALSLVLLLNWPDFVSLLPWTSTPVDWGLRPRIPVSQGYLFVMLAAMSVVLILFIEELYRGLRRKRSQ
jgi:hypothetical protein